MALNTTTLTGAVTIDQNIIAVAAATGFAAGSFAVVDHEVMEVQEGYVAGSLNVPVLRGRDGTATTTHASAARITVGVAADFLSATEAQQATNYPISTPGRRRTSISATGALPLPLAGNDLDVFLNGTTIIAATLANPTNDMDGSRLTVIGNGKAAHTITYTAGLGGVGATADVITFSATQAGAVQLVAAGGFWNSLGTVVGAASVGGPGIA